MTRVQAKLVLTAVVVTLSAYLVACSHGLTYTDPARPIEVAAGQAFALSLPGDPQGRRVWRLTQEPDPSVATLTAAKQVNRQYLNLPPEEQHEEFWTFLAAGQGETTLTLAYVNTDDGAVSETRTYTIRVNP